MAILTFILMLDPSRLITPPLPPASPTWICAKVDDLKKIDFGATAMPAASPDFDRVTMKVRELLPVTFDRL